MVRAYRAKPENGSLHIVFDDGNVEDSNVDFCLQYALDVGDVEGASLAIVLRWMSKTQRGRLRKLSR